MAPNSRVRLIALSASMAEGEEENMAVVAARRREIQEKVNQGSRIDFGGRGRKDQRWKIVFKVWAKVKSVDRASNVERLAARTDGIPELFKCTLLA